MKTTFSSLEGCTKVRHKHNAHIRTRLKRRVFVIMLLVVLAGRQPAFVLRTKSCSKTPSFQVAEFYRETNLGLCKAKTQEILTDFRVF